MTLVCILFGEDAFKGVQVFCKCLLFVQKRKSRPTSAFSCNMIEKIPCRCFRINIVFSLLKSIHFGSPSFILRQDGTNELSVTNLISITYAFFLSRLSFFF